MHNLINILSVVDGRELHLDLCNAVMHIFICLCAFAAFKPMCVISWYFPVSFPLWKVHFYDVTESTHYSFSITKYLPPFRKTQPFTQDPNMVTKDNRLEAKQGKSRPSTFDNFPARLRPCRMSRRGKSWLSFWHVIISFCVIRLQEPCRSQDQLLYAITCFHCKTNNSATFKPAFFSH